jgi:outer membrane protein assembly factor BamB
MRPVFFFAALSLVLLFVGDSPMRSNLCMAVLISACFVSRSFAADWPQWRGPNRDGKADGFKAPSSWPQELTKKWTVTVGIGDSTPALVGDKVYTFSRQDDDEVTTCLDASIGKVLWQEKYPTITVTGGPASLHSGPRSSPTVSSGKVWTLGVAGVLSCFDANTGNLHWRKEDFKGAWPQFYTSSSPIIVDGVCIAQLGGRNNGGVVAYDAASSAERWRWTGDGPAYGSPVLLTVGNTKAILAPTDSNLVALSTADGKVLWQVKYSQGRYNTGTPIVNGSTLIYAGPAQGMTAEKLDKQGEELTAAPLWKNGDNSMNFNTPVLKDGLLYGISATNALFCVKADSGQTAWNAPLSPQAGSQPAPPPSAPPPGKGGKGGRGGGGATAGYASVVDAGPVLFALTSAAQLVVFEPSATEFKQIATYKVADGGTYAHPVVSGNNIYIKDKDSLTLWTVE